MPEIRIRVWSAVAALLLGCGSPANNSALFSSNGTSGAGSHVDSDGGAGNASPSGGAGNAASSANAGGSSSNAPAGGQLTEAGGSADAAAGDGGSSSAGTQSGGAGAIGGTGAVGGTLGSGGSDGGGMPNAGNAGNAGGGTLQDCSAFGQDATFYSANAHCYLVVHDDATFADSRTHCAGLGAHLVTLSDSAENDFVWSLDTAVHWIGATDGRGPKEMMPGTYAWIDNEPFTYTDWSTGQPNASASTCGDGNGNGDGGTCYEHCAFQWDGGTNPGEWNDRLCSHTIESICEWDGPK